MAYSSRRHEFAYLIEGELTFEIEGIGKKVVKAGELGHILPGVAHYGQNVSEKLARTLVIRVKDKSKPIMVTVEDPFTRGQGAPKNP